MEQSLIMTASLWPNQPAHYFVSHKEPVYTGQVEKAKVFEALGAPGSSLSLLFAFGGLGPRV